MSCEQQNLPCMTIGDDYDWPLTWRDGSGNAVPVNNSIIWFTMKETLADSDADALAGTKGLQVSYTIPDDADATAGNYLFNIPNAKTAVLKENVTYTFSFRWEPVAGKPKTLGSGKVKAVLRATTSFTPP